MQILKFKILILILIFFVGYKYSYAQKTSKVDSLKNLLQTVKEKDKPKILNKIIWKTRNSNPVEAVKYGKQSIELSLKYKKYKELSKAYGFSGVSYRNLGSYPDAFDNYFKGLKVSRKNNLKTQEGYALINIGNLYIYQKSYDDAINYLSKAVIIADSLGNKKMSAYCNLNLGRSNLLKKNYEEAIPFFSKTLEIRTDLGDKEGQAVCYKYIADVYLGKGEATKAFETYKKSLETVELTDKDLLSDIYEKLAKTALLQNKKKEAYKAAETSLRYAKITQSKLRIKNAYTILAEINTKSKNYKEANQYQRMILALNDSLYNQRLSQSISNIKYSSEQEKQQAKIKFLKKTERIKATELQKTKQFQLFLIIALIFMIIVVIISIFLSKKLKVQNAKLSIQQKEIIDKNEKLNITNSEIQNKNEEINTINAQLNEQQEELRTSLKAQEELNQRFFAKNIELEQGKIELEEAHNLLKEQQGLVKKKNFELNKTLELITTQQENLQKVNKDITDSINYAKTIQDALLTRKEMLDSLFNDYFLLFKPKEKVSGDFYYANKIGKHIIFAVGDCTGHGVPGGFLTILGITYLHGAIRRQEALTTGDALDILRQRIKDIFVQFGTTNQNGLDIVLCAIDTETNEMQYSGAYNPLLIVREGDLIEYKATRNPIGYYPKEKPFETNKIQLENNDILYLASDGYQDQLGGEHLRKFKTKRFKELLLQIHTMSLSEQKTLLESIHTNWQGKHEQTDDIAVMGIKWKC